MQKLLHFLANGDRCFVNYIRVAIFIVMAWIGGLKVCQYEADGIVPFVTNSPFMSFFYHNTGKTAIDEKGVTGPVVNGEPVNKGKEVAQYKLHKNPEGKMVKANIEWHKENGTYAFSYGLGAFICLIGLLTLLGIWSPKIGVVGGLLTFGMSIVTLSFLITTPEVYVPNLGGDMPTPHYGFPYLSGAGRLVLKDIIMSAGGLIAASEAARRLLKAKQA
jgi:uncharacterized protein HI_0219